MAALEWSSRSLESVSLPCDTSQSYDSDGDSYNCYDHDSDGDDSDDDDYDDSGGDGDDNNDDSD